MEFDSVDLLMDCKRKHIKEAICNNESSTSEEETDTQTVTKRHCHFEWTKYDPKRKLETFIGNPGIKIFPNNPQCISQVAELFVGNDLIEKIINKTNNYAQTQITNKTNTFVQASHRRKRQKRSENWANITVREMKKFLAVSILMGRVRRGRIEYYWLGDRNIFSKAIAGYRFQQILHFLHFSDDEETAQNPNKSCEIELVTNYFVNKFSTVYKPEQELSLDEAVIPYCGRYHWPSVSYIPEHRVLTRLLCETSTGYICNFELCCRKDDNLEKSLLNIFNKNEALWHHVYMDSYYNSVKQAKQLLEKKIRICGIIQSKKRGFPKELNNVNLDRDEFDFRRKDEVVTLRFNSNSQQDEEVRMISTIHNVGIVGISRIPTTEEISESNIKFYLTNFNKCLKSVHPIHRCITHHTELLKSEKWTKKMFIFLVYYALFNSFIVYRKLNPNIKISFSEYLLQLAYEWIG